MLYQFDILSGEIKSIRSLIRCPYCGRAIDHSYARNWIWLWKYMGSGTPSLVSIFFPISIYIEIAKSISLSMVIP